MNICKRNICQFLRAMSITLIAGFFAPAYAAEDPGPPSGNGVQPVFHDGNPSCSEFSTAEFEFRAQPVESKTYTDLGTGFSVTINVYQTSGGTVFDFNSNFLVDDVFVKGGPNGNLYSYNPAVSSDTMLHSPINPTNGDFYGLSHISFCYERAASIEVTKSCINASTNSAGTEFAFQYFTTIKNTGAFELFDPSLREDIALDGINDFCVIAAVEGSNIPHVDLDSGVWTPIPGVASLNPGESTWVRIRCDSTTKNPLVNVISGGLSTSDGLSPPDVVGSDSGGGPDCAASPDPTLKVEKVCRDVRLMAMDGILAVEVLVHASIENTGNEKISEISVVDDMIGTIWTDGMLLPGEKRSTDLWYLPPAPDQNPITGTDDKYDPETAMFTDTITAEGRGVLSGNVLREVTSATCDLCPQP